MKKIKKIISGIIWTIAGLVLLLYVLLRIPAIQQMIGNQVSSALEDKLGTKVSVGRVDIGLLNRITVDDVLIYDQQQKKMLQASRIAAKIDLMPLTEGRISISSAQLFGLHAILYKQTADSKPNFQFVIDSLSTKKKEKTPLDLRIKSLVIRNGRVQYDQYDQPKTAGQLSPYHLDIRNISSHLMLNALTDDSLSFKLKKLTMQEQSGLDIRAMNMEINANKKKAVVEDFYLQLPHSEMTIDQLRATYHMKDGKLDKQSLHFAANLKHSEITPSDLTCLAPALKNFKNKIYIQTAVTGTTNSLAVNDLDISSQTGSIRLQANGTVNDLSHTPLWNAAVKNLHLSAEGISFVAQNMEGRSITIPKEIVRMGSINFKGNLSGHGKVFNGKGDLQTDAGNANLALALDGQEFQTSLKTTGINLQRILDNNRLGQLIADIQAHGKLGTSPVITAKGVVSRFDYNGYNFRDIHIDGTYQNGQYDGLLAINDPNGKIDFDGIISTRDNHYIVKANIQHFNPSAMNLTSQWKGRVFDMNITGDITGSTVNNARGTLDIRGFNMRGGEQDYALDHLTVKTGYDNQAHLMEMQSDFGSLSVNGQYDFQTLAHSFTRLIASKLPTLPGLPKNIAPTRNNITINADDMANYKNVGEMADFINENEDEYENENENEDENEDRNNVSNSSLLTSRSSITLPKSAFTHPLIAKAFAGFCRMHNGLVVKGTENIPQKGPFILAPNHQSFLDGPLAMAGIKWGDLKNYYFYATEEHVQGSLRRWFAAHHNIILMERRNLKNSIVKMAEVLRAGKNIVIFPEGRRTNTGDLGTFKKTFAILSQELQVPILPVCIRGAYDALPRERTFPSTAHIEIEYLPPVNHDAAQTPEELAEIVKQHISDCGVKG